MFVLRNAVFLGKPVWCLSTRVCKNLAELKDDISYTKKKHINLTIWAHILWTVAVRLRNVRGYRKASSKLRKQYKEVKTSDRVWYDNLLLKFKRLGVHNDSYAWIKD